MEQIPLRGFVGSAYGPQCRKLDVQDLDNWYVEYAESQFATQPNSLLPAPGFELFVLLPKSPVRGLWAQNDRAFAVADDSLYELSRTPEGFGAYTERAMTVLATPSAPTITNSPLAPAISAPEMPIITHGGTLGATTYGYRVTAINDLGETTGSDEGTSAYGNATLSSTNYNVIAWAAVEGATGYKVYRTTGTGSGVLVGIVQSDQLFLLDVGTAGTAAAVPVSNTTGGVIGATTYGYKIVARLGLGHTVASGEGVTNTGQATLDDDNFNTVTWPAVPNAHSYDVYRTTGGPTTPPVLLGNTADVTFDDTGADGESATPPTGSTTGTASLENDEAPVSMASSGDAGNQLLIVSGGAGAVFDLDANTLAPVVEGATSAGYIGGYFVILDAATSTMKVSELLDGFAWDDGQVYQRLNAGDRWLSMGVTANEIWLFGSNATDVWTETGDEDTRFAPFNKVQVDQGIIATASIDSVSGSSFMWLGQNTKGGGIIWISEGYTAIQVSSRGIEEDLETYSTLADAFAWSYQQGGHHFYVLTFPSDNKSWVYDRLTKEWHRRSFYDPNDMADTAYRPMCHAFAFGGIGFGLHLVGDRLTGRVCTMSTSLGTDIDGTTLIRRLRQSPHVTNNKLQLSINALIIDLDVGEGLETGQGSDPVVCLQVSKDGGKTWGSVLRRSAGKQGEWNTRVKFTRLGAARDWVFRVWVTDPVAWRIVGAFYEPEGSSA